MCSNVTCLDLNLLFKAFSSNGPLLLSCHIVQGHPTSIASIFGVIIICRKGFRYKINDCAKHRALEELSTEAAVFDSLIRCWGALYRVVIHWISKTTIHYSKETIEIYRLQYSYSISYKEM